MNKQFDYFYVEQPQGQLQVPCIGDTCIKMFNDLGYYWFIQIGTNLGFTETLQHGPYSDAGVIPANSFEVLYNKIPYDENKLCRLIEKDLTNARRGITQAILVEKAESLDALHQVYMDYYEQRNNS